MSDNSGDKLTRRQTLATLLAAGMATAITARPARAADFGAFNTGRI